jgi:uncharacterized protein (DUF924 family)
MPGDPLELVEVWRDAGPRRWFRADPAFDDLLRARFLGHHRVAAAGGLTEIAASPEGALTRILLLDQIPRNIFRNTAEAFASDARARTAAEAALAQGLDLELEPGLRPFVYMPLSHAEEAAAQARALELFARYAKETGEESFLRFARLRRNIVARFGRFPHRNALLLRPSTPEETAFLAAGGYRG